MFGPTQEPPAKRPCYGYIVLSDRDENLSHPFAWYPRSMFSSNEIKDRWIDSILDQPSRIKEFFLEKIPEKKFTLFGKIQMG